MSEPPPGEHANRQEKRSPWFARRRSTDAHGEDTSPAGEQERQILQRLSQLKVLEVREVMTPRLDVTALSVPVEADAVAQAVRETGHSCFPVVGDELDDLVGVLYVTDLFRTGRSGDQPTSLEISKRIREPHLLFESLTVLEALADLRAAHRAFAVVVDEFGGVAGVLTIKDLLEPLVGDLVDEFDAEEEPAVVRVDRTRWLVDGRASLDEDSCSIASAGFPTKVRRSNSMDCGSRWPRWTAAGLPRCCCEVQSPTNPPLHRPTTERGSAPHRWR